MDRRSWPWKKKSISEKAVKAAAAALDSAAAADASAAAGSQGEQDSSQKPKYVQISVESYSHLTGLKDQVKTYEEEVQMLKEQIEELNEKLSEAHSEISTKEDLVKQHCKVAEEAVSGWETAEAEALALKNHLETVTLSKLTAEDRAAHLDGALKECMRQIRNLKEEHEQKLQDVLLTKTKQCDKIRLEFEVKIANFEQELLRSAAENASLSRSLQERANMLIKISEEKSQAEAEIEHLRGNIEQCEREINSAKYELHIVSKELEIRNEEKNMSMRSAEAANKQHMEGVKKIAKLEAECQRLRGLVRKKLPGPAALAQMKMEVESLGRDYGDTKPRRSPVKPTSPHLSSVSEFSLDNIQKFQKENEFLTERLLSMEEETKMLKESLANRNSELQASRNLCVQIANKLQSLEGQMQTSTQQKSPSDSVVQITAEGCTTQNASNPPSLTSMSEDVNDDKVSCADSWATASVSELSQIKKEKYIEKSKAETPKHLGLMDDFLEMEKLACFSNDTSPDGAMNVSDVPHNKISEIVNNYTSGGVTSGEELRSEQQWDMNPSVDRFSNTELSVVNPEADARQLQLMNLRSRISKLLESISKDADMGKIVEDIKRVVEDEHVSLHQHSVSCESEEVKSSDVSCNTEAYPGDACINTQKKNDLTVHIITRELEAAITQIHDFILFLGKEARAVHDSTNANGFSQKIEEFSVSFNKAVHSKASLVDFVFALSYVLAKAGELRINVMGYKDTEIEPSSPDCIDKVVLPENKVLQRDMLGEIYPNGRAHISNPTSDPEAPNDGNIVAGYVSKTTACKFSLEEFEELKMEKDNLATDLARCTENLGMTESQLHETEQQLAEVKSQLASAQKSNSLAETQLKCMVESYRSLETRAQELESEVKLLQEKIETLENEIRVEKMSHNDALARCKELEEQLQRNKNCVVFSSEVDDDKIKQKELAAAAEKLAECQETIYLLGKQLKSLHPQPEVIIGSPYNERRNQKGEGIFCEEPATTSSSMNLQQFDHNTETDTASSANAPRVGGGAESPLELYFSSDNEASINMSPIHTKHSKHRPTKSTSSSSLSRFFSAKGRNGH